MVILLQYVFQGTTLSRNTSCCEVLFRYVQDPPNYCLTFLTECSDHGNIRLTQTTTEFYSNGTSGLIGNLQFCTGLTWTGVCGSALGGSNATIFCRQLGYASKE